MMKNLRQKLLDKIARKDTIKCVPAFVIAGLLILILTPIISHAQSGIPTESDYYEIVDIPIPDGIVLEVGGMDVLPDGSLAVCTRRGEVWIINNPDSNDPGYQLFAEGLHEPLGLTYRDGAIYVTQRPEITRLEDSDNDGRADQYETIWDRPLSGNYHEYFYGPEFLPNGDMLVTVNLAWIGYGEALSLWDGWLLQISPDGEQVKPIASGLRSPAGFGFNAEGDLFYAENQGDWVGSGNITHLEEGDFAGNPRGLRWSDEPGSPLSLKLEDIPDTGQPKHVVAKDIPQLKTPSVWFPHGVMGISTSGILLDDADADFGPFDGQLFVGDQGQSKVMRVFQEKVKGEYQGVVFPFKEGFESGVLRMSWATERPAMYVGMTSRGWSSTGPELYGLQQLVWNGETPFEIKEVHAKPDGFELTFTKSVDRQTASDPSSYEVTGFTYKYHSTYGSDIINQEDAPVTHVQVAEDGLSARLVVDNIREGYIHEIKAEGVRQDETGYPLLHSVGYYTMKNIPEGDKLNVQGTTSQSETGGEEDAADNDNGKHQTEQPASWSNGPDQVITINAAEAMTFDVTDFEVKAGSRVRIVFNNPTDLLHNLLIVKQGELETVAQNALNMGLDGPKLDYVPQTDNVLFYTSLLEVGESESIYFTAPEQPDDYPYVCTFPGHWRTMQGTMRVTD
jgi:azurin